MIRGLIVPLVLALPAAAFAAPLAPPQEPEPKPEEVERLTAWPELDKETKKTVKKEINRLRKARTPEMGETAHTALADIGAGIVPDLLPTLGKEKSDEGRARIEAALRAVTDARHTRLLAKEFGNKSVTIRMFVQRRVARFPDAGTRAEAEAALTAAKALAKKQKAEKYEVYVASLAVTAAGAHDGLPELFKQAKRRWGRFGKEMRAALNAIRGPEATTWILDELREGDREEIVAGLHLLAGCGDRDTCRNVIRKHLDSTDNSIRVSAINAARGIVDGDPPLDQIPVFKAIELAKSWKSRL
jgi:hypothetical protein